MHHRSVCRYRPGPVPDDDGIRAIYHERETAGWARYLAAAQAQPCLAASSSPAR